MTSFFVKLPYEIICYNLQKSILILVHEKTEPSLNTNSLNSQGSKCLIFLIVFNILLAVSLPYGLTYVFYSKTVIIFLSFMILFWHFLN